MNEKISPTCRKCNGKCKESKALKPVGLVQTDSGEGFFWSDAVGIIDCQKCVSCGHSFILGSNPNPNNALPYAKATRVNRIISEKPITQPIARPIDHDQQ